MHKTARKKQWLWWVVRMCDSVPLVLVLVLGWFYVEPWGRE